MIFSPRLIVLVAGGAVISLFLVLAASLSTGQVLAFLLCYNGLLVLGVLADRHLTSKPEALRLERFYEHHLSLGAENPIMLKVENRSRIAQTVIIKDEPPFSFKASSVSLQAIVPAGSVVKLRYTLEPPSRGDYCFGRLNCRYLSRLGLFWRQFAVEVTNNHIRVYPNIREIRKYELFARRGHLLEVGIKPSRVVGLGTDFDSIRDYQVDDEFRRINWGATARRGRMASNRYEVDKSQNILLVLDAGRMMSGEVAGLTKLDHAINAALLLGYVGVNRDDKVGLVAFAGQVKFYLPPGRGRPQLQKLLSGLCNIQPEVVESDYQAASRYIAFKQRKRSLICVFTDLIDGEASRELITYIAALAKNHLVMCISLLETSLVEQAGRVPSNSQEVYEIGVARTVLCSRAKAVALLKNRGVVVVSTSPAQLSITLINKYLEIKSRARL
ncbi:MAG TPA: DUF58 domain-containing protein [Firmicutes bacterium]|nr:DUF58 domain-containing protein [Bacillota bacterium]